MEVLLADAMFGKNRMTEAGYDVDGNGVIEENELVDLQRLNYSTPGGMRRGEMQVPAGGFSRYAQSMCNKAKAERVRREQRERELLGSPHCPKGTMVRVATGELVPLGSWRGSDLVSGLGSLQPLIKETGATPTRVFASKKSDGKLKNHETKDRALVTSNVALPKKQTPPSGTANKRSPLSGSHSSDAFDDAHDAFTKDEHTERARLHAQTGRPAPKVAPTPETEERHQAALALTSRSAPSFAQLLISFFGAGDESLPRVSSSDKAAMVATEVQKANYKASAEKLLPEGYNGSYNAVVQQMNSHRAEETRQDIAVWQDELQNEEQKYMDKAMTSRATIHHGRVNTEMAKEEVLRAKQMEAEEVMEESKRLHTIARKSIDTDQKAKNERAAQSFDRRYLTIDEVVATLQKFSPEEASLTPRSFYTMEPESRSPSDAYLRPFKNLSDQVAKENAALYARIHNIAARTDVDISDEAAGEARDTMAEESDANKKEKAKKLAAQNKAFHRRIADTKAKVDADYDETPLDKND
jgi:hypothetical protein